MASPQFQALVDDLFGELSADSLARPYKPEDRDAEAAKIARLKQLRLARTCAAAAAPTRRRGAVAAR
jgi:hypothetical protein